MRSSKKLASGDWTPGIQTMSGDQTITIADHVETLVSVERRCRKATSQNFTDVQ